MQNILCRVAVVDTKFRKNPSSGSKVIREDTNSDNTTSLSFITITERKLKI